MIHVSRAPAAYLVVSILGAGLLSGCAGTPTVPVQKYEPTYTYSAARASRKADVTIALVKLQTVGDGTEFKRKSSEDEFVSGFFKRLDGGTNEVLIAKGFGVTGPFDTLESMSFPEKKGADFVLFAEFDVKHPYSIQNRRMDSPSMAEALLGGSAVPACDAVIKAVGQVSFVAVEPLTKEKMWVKRYEVQGVPRTFQGRGEVCSGLKVTQEIRNGWGRALEDLFSDTMRSLDKYVNVEEFQMLKQQAVELRGKKVY